MVFFFVFTNLKFNLNFEIIFQEYINNFRKSKIRKKKLLKALPIKESQKGNEGIYLIPFGISCAISVFSFLFFSFFVLVYFVF